ncbi:hypothetical protein GGR51DRAFT_526813 [Nemania sp. FL0031]|nr:hypothetical protein GGR51DRAFT_526813 [Nemania sp. FL0031]
MASPSNLDLPIALRREPRRCVSASAAQPTSAPAPAVLKTPSKARPKKRVRFSDPGPELSQHGGADPSTGLTPMMGRSSLREAALKRRRSTPRRAASTGSIQEETPSGRKKNAKSSSRKAGDAVKAKIEAELERLRAELANRDAEIERLQNETIVHDTDRILELEQELQTLRTELAQQQLPPMGIDAEDEDGDADDLPSKSFYDWTLAARDPFSDSYLDGDDSRDITMDEVACSTPSRKQKSGNTAAPRSVSASFPTPPCTSPTIPATPCSVRKMDIPLTPSHVGVQVSLPDPDKEALEAELASLRLELAKMTQTLETHAEVQAHLAERLSNASKLPSAPTNSESNQQEELERHLDAILQQLEERTIALLELDLSLSTLGFEGSDAEEMINTITASLRAARLEIEYLMPGEVTLPLSSHGAEVLDLILTSIRDLSRKVVDKEAAIDEYHSIELSLRQQLTARVDAMDGMRAAEATQAQALRERDTRIEELEFGLERLKGAAEGYRGDIRELETLVERLDTEGREAESNLTRELKGAQAELAVRVSVIADLETRLASTLRQAEELEGALADCQRQKKAEAKVRNKSYGAALALRDARVLELRREIYEINESLRNAHETIMMLRAENVGLEQRMLEAEKGTRLDKETIDMLKAELEKVTAAAAPKRVTRSSTRGLATPEPQAGRYLSGELARSGTGKAKKRRRPDSGLGLLSEDEADLMT